MLFKKDLFFIIFNYVVGEVHESQKSRGVGWCPGTGVTGHWELPSECWEANRGPLKEQSVLFTEPSFQPSSCFSTSSHLWQCFSYMTFTAPTLPDCCYFLIKWARVRSILVWSITPVSGDHCHISLLVLRHAVPIATGIASLGRQASELGQAHYLLRIL